MKNENNLVLDINNIDKYDKEWLSLTLMRLQYIRQDIPDKERLESMFELLKVGGFGLIKVEKE
jgi:hypothetical protein